MTSEEPASGLTGAFGTAGWHVGNLVHVPHVGRRGRWMLAGFVLLAWLGSGIYKVSPDEQGVVLLFGRAVGTEMPGLHYHLPFPMSSVLLPKVTKVTELRGPAPEARRMLTGDENLVEAEYTVSWKIKDSAAFLFHVQDPEAMVSRAAEAAMHEVIGRNPIQAALSDRRQEIAAQAEEELQRMLDAYGAGIMVIRVQLQRVDPPAAVIDAFNDVQRARADQERVRNEAEAYRNDMLPHARGEAEHVVQQAEAYRKQAIDQAQGEVSAFLSAYNSYLQAPQVFAWRVYLDSMDDLLSHASRVVVDASGKGGAGVVPYLPLGDVPMHRPADAAPPSPPPLPPLPQLGAKR